MPGPSRCADKRDLRCWGISPWRGNDRVLSSQVSSCKQGQAVLHHRRLIPHSMSLQARAGQSVTGQLRLQANHMIAAAVIGIDSISHEEPDARRRAAAACRRYKRRSQTRNERREALSGLAQSLNNREATGRI